jgi:uncharacterized protein
MHCRSLGSTGLTASIVGLGSSPFRRMALPSCARLLQEGLEFGINYYDTARSYVNGEEAVGHLPSELRNRLIVATKTGARGGRYCIRDLQISLRNLRRDHIDVWMAHMIQDASDYEMCCEIGGFCDIATSAKQAGLVRAIGASFHAHTDVILRAIEEGTFDVVMFQLNVIGRETVFGSSIAEYREKLLPSARKRGVGVVAMKVLAGGELRHGAERLKFLSDAQKRRDTVGGAVRYIAMNPSVTTAVVGMESSEQLFKNVMAIQGVDDSQLDEFEEWTHLVSEFDGSDCTRCGTCLGTCPQAIEIPKILRMYHQLRYYGMTHAARWKYKESGTKASLCDGCGICQTVCPKSFDIPEALKIAHVALSDSTPIA